MVSGPLLDFLAQCLALRIFIEYLSARYLVEDLGLHYRKTVCPVLTCSLH